MIQSSSGILNLSMRISILIFMCFLLSAKAQSIRPFIDTTSEWYVGGWRTWGPNPNQSDQWGSKYFIDGDTIVDSVRFYKVYHTRPTKDYYLKGKFASHLIREDSLGKVFVRDYYGNNSKYLDEFLLYDFGLKPGDTMVYDHHNKSTSCMYADTVTSVLDYIDSVLISGIYLKRYHFIRNEQHPSESIWLEGIGSVDLSTFGPFCGYFESGEYFACYRSSSLNWKFSESCYYLDVPENANAKSIVFYPNPAGDELFIKNNPNDLLYELYNSMGQMTVSGIVIRDDKIELYGISKGMYQLILKKEGRVIWKGAILKE